MLYGRDRTSTTGYGYNQRTPEPLDESTQKLFDAIGKENLENFKHSIEVGADVTFTA
ncbi:hypothetical protein [Wolbachia pipientis]|uniref:hypothetical protein n=1 Tax=Wolbachia pipientis TaxID=955 RepID=UPI0021752E35|nr:hypothetical protein [Wolbachia pipientis]